MALPAEKLEAQETIAYSSHESSDSATANNQQESSGNTGTFLPPIKQVSEYVQLAKAGGHKDLIAHHPFVQDDHAKPVPYSRVEWWDHPPGVDVVVGRSKPRYFRRSLPAVIDDATPIRLPRIKPLSPEDKWNEAIWKPNPVKTTHQDRLPSIGEESVANLIALKYQKEWVASNEQRCKLASDKKKAQRLLKKQRLLEHTKRKNDDATKSVETEKPFKMKRFENISSKVHTYYEGT
ncbi:uncharacterized protein [Dysidea avara]|uniref:uncharacterized protein n=1 Tax=Dysidea avara TaxID=196820 RepID=UPI00331CB6A8